MNDYLGPRPVGQDVYDVGDVVKKFTAPPECL